MKKGDYGQTKSQNRIKKNTSPCGDYKFLNGK